MDKVRAPRNRTITLNDRDRVRLAPYLISAPSLDGVIKSLKPFLKPTATIYICGDWFTSASVFEAASNHLIVRNRITWEREKGRGA